MGYMQWTVQATQQNATKGMRAKKLMTKVTLTTVAWFKQYKICRGLNVWRQHLPAPQIGNAPLGIHAPKDSKPGRALI